MNNQTHLGHLRTANGNDSDTRRFRHTMEQTCDLREFSCNPEMTKQVARLLAEGKAARPPLYSDGDFVAENVYQTKVQSVTSQIL